MEYTEKEKQAELLAEFIHFGQKRKNGEPYVNHPKRVAESLKKAGYDEDVVSGGFLHDSEDYKYLAELFRIIDNTFGYNVYGLVLALTHIPKDLPYKDYLYSIAMTSDEAMAIKWHDMIDNTTDKIPYKQYNKYRNACLFLKSKNVYIASTIEKRLMI